MDAKFFLSAEKRRELPSNVFGYPKKRLFPILSEKDVMSAAKLIGRAKLTDKEREQVKRRIINIAMREGYKLPEAWASDSGATVQAELSANQYVSWTSTSGNTHFGVVKSINNNNAIVELCENANGELSPVGFEFECSLDDLDSYTK